MLCHSSEMCMSAHLIAMQSALKRPECSRMPIIMKHAVKHHPISPCSEGGIFVPNCGSLADYEHNSWPNSALPPVNLRAAGPWMMRQAGPCSRTLPEPLWMAPWAQARQVKWHPSPPERWTRWAEWKQCTKHLFEEGQGRLLKLQTT